MDLQTFIADPERKRLLADRTKSSEGYLWQVATGWRQKRASAELAMAIERHSAEIGPEPVSKASLRPDLWASEAVPAASTAQPRTVADASTSEPQARVG